MATFYKYIGTGGSRTYPSLDLTVIFGDVVDFTTLNGGVTPDSSWQSDPGPATKAPDNTPLTPPAGPPIGTGGVVPAWAATTLYSKSQAALDPSGNLIVRIAGGTSRSTYDATEQAAWTTVSSVAQLGPAMPLWTTGTSYTAGQVVMHPTTSGLAMRRVSSGVARNSFDATEQALWVYLGSATYPTFQDLAGPVGSSLLSAPTRIGKRAGLYNRSAWLYTPTKTCFQKWNIARARAMGGGTYARVNTYGDSITDGYLGTPQDWQAAYTKRLSEQFATDYGAAGEGLVWLTGAGFDSRLVFTGSGWQVLSGFGPFGNWAMKTNVNNDTPGVQCDSYTIYYIGNSGSSQFAWSVDGGSETIVSTVQATQAYYSTTVSAGTLGSHTLKIRNNAADNLYIVAVEANVGTSGVRVTRTGKGGAQASSLVASSSGAADDPLHAAFNMIPPDLSIIWFGHNEYLNSTSVATFTTNMQTLITSGQTSGDVLLVTSVANSDTSRNPSQALYDQAVYQLADKNNCAVLDLRDKWGDWATANAAGLMGDVTHPDNAGYTDIGNAVYAAIGQLRPTG